MPGAALAQGTDSLDDTYASDQQVLGEVDSVNSGPSAEAPSSDEEPVQEEAPVTPAAPVADSGSLPFTGFDAALIAGGGLLLLAGGFVLRRIARPQP